MVEFNVEDIKELKRITTLELQGTLDADGVKQFVEVTYRDIIHPASLGIWWHDLARFKRGVSCQTNGPMLTHFPYPHWWFPIALGWRMS